MNKADEFRYAMSTALTMAHRLQLSSDTKVHVTIKGLSLDEIHILAKEYDIIPYAPGSFQPSYYIVKQIGNAYITGETLDYEVTTVIKEKSISDEQTATK